MALAYILRSCCEFFVFKAYSRRPDFQRCWAPITPTAVTGNCKCSEPLKNVPTSIGVRYMGKDCRIRSLFTGAGQKMVILFHGRFLDFKIWFQFRMKTKFPNSLWNIITRLHPSLLAAPAGFPRAKDFTRIWALTSLSSCQASYGGARRTSWQETRHVSRTT